MLYNPTREQIREECRRIRSTWSPEERRSRLGQARKARAGIRIVGISSLPLTDKRLIDELYSWPYLSDTEAKKAQAISSEKPEPKQDPVEHFEAEVVQFGE